MNLISRVYALHPVHRTELDKDADQQPDPLDPSTLLAVKPLGLNQRIQATQVAVAVTVVIHKHTGGTVSSWIPGPLTSTQ